MAVTQYTKTYFEATYNGVDWSVLAPRDQFGNPEPYTLLTRVWFIHNWRGVGFANQQIGYIDFGDIRLYPYATAPAPTTGDIYGPYTVKEGTKLCRSTRVDLGTGYSEFKFTDVKTTVAARTELAYEGYRKITLTCSAGGSVIIPQVAGGGSVVAKTLPVGDVDKFDNILDVVKAGDGAPFTGTLLTRGLAAGVWVNWTWTKGVLESDSETETGVATDKEITLSLIAGMADAVLTANFTQAANSASVWSPLNGKVVVHLLNSAFGETNVSTNFLASATKWREFRGMAFKTPANTFKCVSGAVTQDWYSDNSTTGYVRGVYLMNVSSATFSVEPKEGLSVYGWELKDAAGAVTSFGSAKSAAISGFSEGCTIHLYLTDGGNPNPRIAYDGFDSTGTGTTVPVDQRVKHNLDTFDVGKVFVAGGLEPFEVTLSPLAWATRVLGQARYAILDSGTPALLENRAGTSTTVLSSAAQFSVRRLKFKQVTLDTDGLLNVTIEQDVVAALAGVTVRVSQESVPLESLEETGEFDYKFGYYVGAGPMSLVVDVDYGEATPENYVITCERDVGWDGDVLTPDETTLSAVPPDPAVTTRAVIVHVTQVVNIGTLTAVDINLTRDTSIGVLKSSTANDPVTPTDSLTAQNQIGSISVTLPDVKTTDYPFTVTCSVNPGYTLKSVRLWGVGEGGWVEYSSVPAPTGTASIVFTLPRSADGADIKVILVASADIVATPTISWMVADDDGKFTAEVDHTGTVYADFRVGDSVKLTARPVQIDYAAIGSPTFNGDTIVPVRIETEVGGPLTSVEATVTLGLGTNVFRVPVYAVLETVSAPEGAGTITLSTAWGTDDRLDISGVTYRRIGDTFTVTAPLKSTTPDTYTLISGKVSRRLVTAGFAYYEVAALLPVVASSTTRTFTAILRGPTELEALYAIGEQYPAFVMAAYDYASESYIKQGIRPTVSTTAVSPAALSDNLIADIAWPETGTPEAAYQEAGAAFLYREVTTTELLPAVSIRISSTVGARLEVWNPTTSLWVPYSPLTFTLVSEFTYFRASVGDPPENLVSVAFQTAVTVDSTGSETNVPGGRIVATSGTVYDGEFVLPATMQARSRTVLHVRAILPSSGFVVTGWYVDDVLTPSGASLSLVVPDAGLTLKPVLAVRSVAALSVMVLNADCNRTDEGIWVSKLFRAQYPWKPLTAIVVARPTNTPVTLAVIKDGGDAPEQLDTGNPGTVSITVTNDVMRRLPPCLIQKSRFVRYMVMAAGKTSISSVAIGAGAETMKGGH